MDGRPNGLIDTLYESSFDETLLHKFVADLAAATNSAIGGIFTHDTESNHTEFFSTYGLPPNEMSLYANKYNSYQELGELVGVRSLDSITYYSYHVTQNDLIKKQSHASFLLPDEIGEGASMVLRNCKKHPVIGGFNRDSALGPYTPKEKIIFAALLPHIQRRFRVTGLAQSTQIDRARQWERFEYSHFGVLIFDNNRELLFANNLAEQMINCDDGFVTSADEVGVRASIKSENVKLQNMIKDNTHEKLTDTQFEQVSFMRISRPSGKRSYNLQVAHIPKKLINTKSYPASIAFIHDTDATFNLRTDQLRTLYNLTSTEAQVAIKISQGKSLEQCVFELGHAIPTSRNLLKKVFAKTETGRQNELVSLLLSSTSLTRLLVKTPKTAEMPDFVLKRKYL
jgi:DNA-binding CsgD family transcriptional regulator